MYHSFDCLADFEFHDAVLCLQECLADRLVLSAEGLNIRQDAAQNDQGCDMEMRHAQISFDGFDLAWYEPGQAWQADHQEQYQPVGEQIRLTGDDGLRAFGDELRAGMQAYALTFRADGSWILSGSGNEPYFEVCFRFRHADIAWDEYIAPAWYVRKARGAKG